MSRFRRPPGFVLGLVAGIVTVALIGSIGSGSALRSNFQSVDEGFAVAGGAAPALAPMPEMGYAQDASGLPAESAGAATGAAAREPAVVVTGSLGLEVADPGSALKAVEAALRANGGRISSLSRGEDGIPVPYADLRPTPLPVKPIALTIRVPSRSLEATLAALRGIGTVLTETRNETEVTGQLVDMEARLRNLRATETAYLAILERAATIDETLAVWERLGSIRGEIESLDAARAGLADQVAYASYTLTLEPPPAAPVEEAQAGWDPGATAERSLARLVEILQGLADAAIGLLIVGAPLALLILVALALVALPLRLVRRRRAARCTEMG